MENYSCQICNSQSFTKLFKQSKYTFLRCAQCDLVRLAPYPDADELDSHYASRSEGGNYDLTKADERRFTLTKIFYRIDKEATKINNSEGIKKILDLGCFDGALLDIAKENGWDVYGLEFQGSAVLIAQEKHGDNVRAGDLETYSFSCPKQFDVISALDVIEHLANPQRFLNIAFEGLKDGGILVLSTPNTASMPCKLLGKYWPAWGAPEHIHYFSRKNLYLLLEKNGFHSIQIFRYIKHLRVSYVMDQLKIWGTRLYSKIRWLYPLVPMFVRRMRLSLYGGEMIVFARKGKS